MTVPLREWHFYRNIVQDDLLSLPQDIHILLLEASIMPDPSKESTGDVDENNCELDESSYCLQVKLWIEKIVFNLSHILTIQLLFYFIF